MENLEELLQREAEAYRPQAAFLRHFAVNVRGLDEHFPMEHDIELHLKACRLFYEERGTIDGMYTPWVLGRWHNGKEE